MKVCSKCNHSKSLSDFHKSKKSKDGLASSCKDCKRKLNADYRNRNKQHIEARKSEYYFANIDIEKEKRAKYYQENKEKIKRKTRRYAKNNRGEVNSYFRKYHAHRQKNDVQYRLTKSLRSRINHILRDKVKTGSAINDLGCSLEELIKHIESKFQPGMSWDNYGEWHIDHIKPLSSFNLEDRVQFLEACNYANLQPLWAHDNLKKGAKIP